MTDTNVSEQSAFSEMGKNQAITNTEIFTISKSSLSGQSSKNAEQMTKQTIPVEKFLQERFFLPIDFFGNINKTCYNKSVNKGENMLAKVLSFGLKGIEGFPVEVEADVTNGLPHVEVVGLADTAIKESKERVRSAIRNSGLEYPIKHITINLAPADMKKEGPSFDLAIAISILATGEEIHFIHPDRFCYIGELSLNGEVKKVKGVLPLLIAARNAGLKQMIIPEGNAAEAAFIEGISVYPVKTLSDCVAFLQGQIKLDKVSVATFENLLVGQAEGLDFSHVKGQARAKRALEIAAAGGHNVIMIGPPGSGKSMLAKCFPSILPDLTFEEALEVTKIHSVAGELDLQKGIVSMRPFRSPHHTASTVSLTGGGNTSKPGEISLAHNGVLFLDEMPEYSRHTIETLRQPLEDGAITVARANSTITYPANFTLIASMNPCPCGNYGCKDKECTCTPTQIHRYLAKLSGPIMDRIDMHIEVDNVTYDDLKSTKSEESSASIKLRVDKARHLQLQRFAQSKVYSNAKMSVPETKRFCVLDKESDELLRMAFERLKLSARAHDRILRVARTIADLDGCLQIQPQHIAEAVSYRTLDRKYWG